MPKDPTGQAWKDLEIVLQPYLPLDRQPRRNTFWGTEIVKHSQKAKGLTKLGLLVTAVEKLEQWQAVIGPAYKERVGESLKSKKTSEGTRLT